jgi:hypothetical protein
MRMAHLSSICKVVKQKHAIVWYLMVLGVNCKSGITV